MLRLARDAPSSSYKKKSGEIAVNENHMFTVTNTLEAVFSWFKRHLRYRISWVTDGAPEEQGAPLLPAVQAGLSSAPLPPIKRGRTHRRTNLQN